MIAALAAVLALAAGGFAATSLARGVRAALARGAEPHGIAAGAGAAAVVALLADGGGLLRWRYALAGTDMRDAGLVLGTALLAALAGTLLTGAVLASGRAGAGVEGPPPRARLAGRRALILAWALMVCGTGLVLARSAGEGLTASPRGPVALLVVVIALGLALWACLSAAAPVDAERAEAAAGRDARAAAVLAVAAALAAGIAGWSAAGTSLTDASRALAAAALFGLAALPKTRLTLARRALVLAALVAALPA